MVLYDFACPSGHHFEAMLPGADSPAPPCPACGAAAHRRPSFARMGGTASPGPSREDAPKSWRTTGNGDPETIRRWHAAMTRREKLEEHYPELAGDRRPVLAHEGRFAANPLRAGDPIPGSTASPTAPAS